MGRIRYSQLIARCLHKRVSRLSWVRFGRLKSIKTEREAYLVEASLKDVEGNWANILKVDSDHWKLDVALRTDHSERSYCTLLSTPRTHACHDRNRGRCLSLSQLYMQRGVYHLAVYHRGALQRKIPSSRLHSFSRMRLKPVTNHHMVQASARARMENVTKH
jgi:hypothetical protein